MKKSDIDRDIILNHFNDKLKQSFIETVQDNTQNLNSQTQWGSKPLDRIFLISSIIGDKLRYLRKAKNLTLEEVANRSGFSSQAISLCERAKRMPSANMLLALSKIYDCSEEELYDLRSKTIIATVEEYGNEAPVSVLNEYEILMNAKEAKLYIVRGPRLERLASESQTEYETENEKPKEYLDLGDEEVTEEEIQLAKAFLMARRTMEKK